MGAQWYYTPDGRTRLGPFSLREMRELARSGRLKPAYMVRRDDSPKWSSAETFAELFPADEAAPPPRRVRRPAPEEDESPARTKKKKGGGAARFALAPLAVLAAPWRAAWRRATLAGLRRRLARQRRQHADILIAVGVRLLAARVSVPGCESSADRLRRLTQAQELARRAGQAGDKDEAREVERLEGELRSLYAEVGRQAIASGLEFDGRADARARLRRAELALGATQERLDARAPKGDAPASPGRWSVLMGCAVWGAAACCALALVTWHFARSGPQPAPAADDRPRTLKELFVDLAPAVPVVEAVGSATGSGFLVRRDDKYLVVTNRHVIENARDGVVVHFLVGDGRGEESRITVAKDQVSVVAIHRSADLAVLDVTPAASLIERLHIAPVRLAERGHRPQVGEHVFTIGHPGGAGEGLLTRTLSDGIVSAVRHKLDEARYLQVTVPLNPGNSGGPLFDDRGRVVGVSTFIIRRAGSGIALEALNFALEGDFVHEAVTEPDKSLDAAAIAAVLKPPQIDTPKDLAAANAKKLERLTKSGYHPLGGARVFRLPGGKQRAFLLTCKKGDEFVLLAVGQGVKNLNLAVLTREGSVLASDDRAHPDPEVPFRAGADGTYALAVENPSGTEAVVVMTLLQK